MRAASRMCLAVVAGAGVIVALTAAGWTADAAAFGVTSSSAPTPAYLLVKSVTGFLAAGLGGWITARLAPRGYVLVTVALLFVLALAMGSLTGRALATPLQPLWFQAIVIMLGASGLPIGAVMEQAWEAGRRARSGPGAVV